MCAFASDTKLSKCCRASTLACLMLANNTLSVKLRIVKCKRYVLTPKRLTTNTLRVGVFGLVGFFFTLNCWLRYMQ